MRFAGWLVIRMRTDLSTETTWISTSGGTLSARRLIPDRMEAFCAY